MIKLEKEKLIYMLDNVIDILNKDAIVEIKTGKFYINRIFTVNDILDTPLPQWNIAMHNFIQRKLDFLTEENGNKYVVYGHADNNLGYFIAEDEILNIDDFHDLIEELNEKRDNNE